MIEARMHDDAPMSSGMRRDIVVFNRRWKEHLHQRGVRLKRSPNIIDCIR
jgi:hypothetical protein